MPFAFDFYGTPVTHFKVSGNGVVTFDTSATATPVDGNTNLPAAASANIPNMSIMGFWDAFTASAPIGSNDVIYTGIQGTAPNRQLWIDYYSYEYGNPSCSFIYWGIVLEEGTNKVYVMDKNYGSGQGTLTATIGVQQNSTTAVQYGDSTAFMNTGSTPFADNDYYEFTPRFLVNDNAAIASIDNPVLPTCALANQSVMATILNDGSNNLTSATVNWSVNGTLQTPFSWTGTLTPSTTAQVTLGTYSFSALDELKVWTAMPNGVADGYTANDTMALTLATGLVGTFTIDSLLPAGGSNFKSFNDAVSFIATNGLCGSVVFNVAAGTWNEGIALPDWSGTAANTVTFNGAGIGVTNLVYDGSGTTNAAILFNGVDYVTFKNMTIENTKSASYAWGIRFTGEADHNTIDSCHVKVDPTTTSSLYAGIIASASATSSGSSGNNCNYTTISNCVVEGGYYGISMYNTTANSYTQLGIQNNIINNVVKEVYYYPIRSYYQDSPTISGNTVESPRNPTAGYGMYVYYTTAPQIHANLVKACGTYGMYLAYANYAILNPTARGSVTNNMMLGKGTGDGVYMYLSSDLDIFHNSFYAEDDQAFYTGSTTTGCDIRNNIFYSKTAAAVDFTTAMSAGTIFDYNLLYVESSSILAENGTANHADLAAWQLAEPALNLYSVQGDPHFVNPATGDLHVTVGAGLIAGDNSVGVATDFDGNPRPWAPTTIVDIGADEIFVQNLDAGITSFDSPLAPVTTGLQDIKVSIKNNGATALTAATINWAVDGTIQTPFAWTGSLTIGNSANDVTIGQYNIASGFTQFEIWTSAPNGSIDGDMSNDTLVYDLCTALAGTYTVGPAATDDFTTIAEAATAVSGCGINGPVTINIAPGIYTDPVYLGGISGASATNTVTFDGIDRDSVLLTYASGGSNSQNATVLFDGATYVTLKNISIENLGAAYAWGVRLQNSSNNNTVQDCKIRVDETLTSTTLTPVLSTGSSTASSTQGDNCNNFTLLNNEIIGGYYGVRLYGAYSASDQSLLNTGNRIEGNLIRETYFYSIYMYYQAGFTIKDNVIAPLRVAPASGYGIYSYMSMNPIVEGNWIQGAGTYGIYLSSANYQYPATKRAKVINNMVNVTSANAEALYLFNVSDMDIYHNTLNATGEQAMYIDNFANMNIRNNIFATLSNTTVDFIDAIGLSDVVNYNLYYRADGSGNLIENGTANYADLASWQLANGGTADASSVSGDPIFKDVSIGDLHVIGGTANDVADNSVPVSIDIDGDARPLAPATIKDMGADEYTPLDDDALATEIMYTSGLCQTATDTVWVTVQNLGLNTITTLPVTVEVTGDATATLSTTAAVNMPFLSTATVAVGTFSSIGGGDYNFQAYTTLAGDQNVENDTTYASGKRLSSTGIVTNVACQGDSTGAINFGLVNPLGLDSKITTNLTSNNGCNANYFDVNVLNPNGLTVTGFEVNMSTAAGTPLNVELYYKTGTWVGFDANGATGWTYAGTMTGTAAGTNLPSVVTLPSSVTLPAGINGIFISGGSGWSYINGTAVGTVWAANNDVQIYEGGGVCNNAIGAGGTILTRNFSGSIIYQGQPAIYAWSTADTTEDLTNLAAGTYSITATDGVGCTTTNTFTVTEPTASTPAIATVTADSVNCFGAADGAINVTVTGGTGNLTYTWSNGDTLQNLANAMSGAYTLIVTDANGCQDSTTTMVGEPAILAAATGTITTVGCDDILVTTNVTGGSGTYAYSWDNGTANASVSITASGTYSAVVTDGNGCTDTLDVTITMPTALSATATVTSADTAGLGVGAAMAVGADGTAPYTFSWSNGQTTDALTGVTFGNYTVTVTDAVGCTTTQTVTIGFPTSTNGLEQFHNIAMFPNPTTGMVTFNVALKSAADLNIAIFDVTGREITNFTATNTTNLTETFDASILADGVYMVRFMAGEGVVTKRLVVSKH